VFSSRLSIFLHATLLLSRLTLQVVLSQLLVFITHSFALTPLYEPRRVVLCLIAPQIVLDFAHMFEFEVVPAKFKIDESLLVLASWVEKVDECAPDLRVEAVVS